jgi:exodeoxyribonuclease VII large subunit
MIVPDPDAHVPFSTEPSEWRVYSVHEITREIKLRLEEGFEPLAVEGEISNFKRHTSGHLYFSLKDAEAQISCVMWRGRNQNLLFEPADGAQVLAFGTLGVYERQGRYQLDLLWMRPLGTGSLQLAFEALKRRLADEGLFDPSHKRPIPEYPARIGVVTSETGAAIKDITSILSRRAPWVALILRPVRVQGPGAAEDIAQAIRDFNAEGSADVLIVGRGGGSLEDLWAFNEEAVARAIYESSIPVVSAVGHEIDFSIADFVADLRAPTPSAAAELVARDGAELFERIRSILRRLSRGAEAQLAVCRERLTRLERSYGLRRSEDRLREYRQRLDDLVRSLDGSARRSLETLRSRTAALAEKLSALDPEAVLRRGYSVTVRIRDQKIVTRSSELEPNDPVRIRLAEGAVRGRVEAIDS